MIERSILIIDDEKRMADSLRDLLSTDSPIVDIAYNGADGIASLQKHPYSVVITDLKMQGVNGIDVIRHVHENLPKTLVIVITGYASTDTAIAALQYQAFDYIRKPFDFDNLKSSVERAFHKKEVDQLREDTAAMITHDIKVPLMSIIGYAAMIHDKKTDELNPRTPEFADTIRSNGQKILGLIDNYLTSCKVETSTLQIQPRPIILTRFIDDLMDVYSNEASGQGVQFNVDLSEAPEQKIFDELLVFRAAGNLLQNAIKYSDRSEPVTVKIVPLTPSQSPLMSNSWRFEVINLAPHLSSNHLEGLFGRFTRATISSGIEGSGIGLYVVDAVANAHGGISQAKCLEWGRVSFSMVFPNDPKPMELV